MRTLDELEPEERELVDRAADLVRELMSGEALQGVVSDGFLSAGLAEMVENPRKLKRQSRKVRRQYRKLRKDVRNARKGPDGALVAQESAQKLYKLATVDHVLHLLVGVAFGDRRLPSEIRWPDGADVTAALEEVVRVLETVAGTDEVRTPDGATDFGGLPAPPGPAGRMPEGMLFDGVPE